LSALCEVKALRLYNEGLYNEGLYNEGLYNEAFTTKAFTTKAFTTKAFTTKAFTTKAFTTKAAYRVSLLCKWENSTFIKNDKLSPSKSGEQPAEPFEWSIGDAVQAVARAEGFGDCLLGE